MGNDIISGEDSISLSWLFDAIPLDRDSLPQHKLDVVDRRRTNPLPWTGQFSPQLVEEILTKFAPKGSVVLDPFVGSGTSLVEAARFGSTAFGFDLNPAAVILSRVYEMTALDSHGRAEVLDTLREGVFKVISSTCDSFNQLEPIGSIKRAALEAALVGLWKDAKSEMIKNLAAALVLLCDFHRNKLGGVTVHKNWVRLEETVNSLPHSKELVSVEQADARAIPLDSNQVDFVLTSPPYINVHNYHQKYRRSVEALGCDVLSSAYSEIGSNRQNRSNRLLTVIQYSLDMALSLREMVRIGKSGIPLIMILGRKSTVRGIPFFNSALVTEIAVQSAGLTIERRQERVFRNRYGAYIYEDIVHFRSQLEPPDRDLSLERARRIAELTLFSVRSKVKKCEREGIESALEQIYDVNPSPLLKSYDMRTTR